MIRLTWFMFSVSLLSYADNARETRLASDNAKLIANLATQSAQARILQNGLDAVKAKLAQTSIAMAKQEAKATADSAACRKIAADNAGLRLQVSKLQSELVNRPAVVAIPKATQESLDSAKVNLEKTSKTGRENNVLLMAIKTQTLTLTIGVLIIAVALVALVALSFRRINKSANERIELLRVDLNTERKARTVMEETLLEALKAKGKPS